MKNMTIFSMMLIVGPANAQPSFVTVGTFATQQSVVSHSYGVSGDGGTVVGFSNSMSGRDAFRWTVSGGLVPIPRIPNTSNYYAFDASTTGDFVLGQYGQNGFVWSEVLGTVAVGDLPGGTVQSIMISIADTGKAVGYSSFGFAPNGSPLNRAILWKPSGGLEALPLPAQGDLNFNSQANAVLPDGRIFGQSASGAWLYSETNNNFEMLDGAEAMTYISPDGAFFGGNDVLNNSPRAAYWTREGGTAFLPLMDGHLYSGLRGMSDDGSVMVGQSFGQSGGEYVVWLDQGYPMTVADYASNFGLDMSQWDILNVSSVSADGTTIVGTARHASWEGSRQEGFVLTIPAPASVAPVALTILALRRRRV